MIDRVDKKLLYLSSFFVPVVLYTVIFMLRGIYPFGDNTVMTGDMQFQFVDYLSYLKTIVFGRNDFAYSFSKNLGGGMSGFCAYYYMCAFNWLTLLFPTSMLPVAESLVIVLYAASSSVSFTYMLSKLYEESYLSVPFAAAYSMMGFTSAYFQLTMYFGGLMLLPLVVLGLFRIIKDPRDKYLYIISLFLIILQNYYSGYMICIFLTFFLIYNLLVNFTSEERETNKFVSYNIMPSLNILRSFVFSSALSAALASFVLLPAVLSLSGEKDNFSLGLFRLFSFPQLFSKLYTGSFRGNVSNGLPNIYCGVLMVFLTFLYFCNKKVALKERLLSGAFLLFLCLNMYINTLNVAWHGFNQPIGFPYRYSYLVSFLMIFFSYRGFFIVSASYIPTQNTEDKNYYLTRAVLCFAVFAAYSCYIIAAGNETIGIKEILLNALLLLIIIGCFAAFIYRKITFAALTLMFLAVQAFDVTYNEYISMGGFALASLSEYQDYIEAFGSKINYLKEEDGGFYRIEKYFRRTHNDAMQFDYAGLSHFSSSEKHDKINFMGKLGFRNNGNWSFYNEPATDFVDSLLGVRYIYSKHHSVANDYERLIFAEDYTLYQNHHALPLMFAAKKSLRDIDYRSYSDPFLLQKDIADNLNGTQSNIFTPAEIIDISAVNLRKDEADGYTHYEKLYRDERAYLEYLVKVENENNLFVYFEAPFRQNVKLYGNDSDMGVYFTPYRWNIVNMQDHDAGSTLAVRLELQGDTLDVGEAYLYFENEDETEKLMDEVLANDSSLRKLTASHLEGNIHMPDGSSDCALITIPYDSAWKIEVDGQKTFAEPAAGMLLSFDAAAGEHRVELWYIPKGRTLGRIISLCALAVLFVSIIYDRRRINLSLI